MRIECCVLTQKRDFTSSNARRKAVKSFITLARSRKNGKNSQSNDNKSENATENGEYKYELVINTSTNRTGMKYLLNQQTVQCVQARFCAEGRATLQMREPALDILISKAQPDRLKRWLALMARAVKGEKLDGEVLDVLENDRKTKGSCCQDMNFVSAPKRMVIEMRSDYPIMRKGFPSCLTELSIVGIGLRNVDARWFGLKSLQILDLKNNLLGEASDFMSRFMNVTRLKNLQVLVLAKNRIKALNSEFWCALPKDVFVLDISENQLSGCLSAAIVRLKRLASLTACRNQLTALPNEICRMTALRVLKISSNNLQFIPASIRCLRLDYVDLAGNEALFRTFAPFKRSPECVPSLVQFAVMCVQNEGMPLDVLPWDLKMCLGGETVICSVCRCFAAKDLVTIQHSQLDLSMIAHTVSRGTDRDQGGSQVLAYYYYCRNCAKFSFHYGV